MIAVGHRALRLRARSGAATPGSGGRRSGPAGIRVGHTEDHPAPGPGMGGSTWPVATPRPIHGQPGGQTVAAIDRSRAPDRAARPAVADDRPVPLLRAPRRRVPDGNERFGPDASLSGRQIGHRLRRDRRLEHVPRRRWSRASRSTRIAGSRPSRTCASGQIDHCRLAGRGGALRAVATCSGSPRARASCTRRCSRCSTARDRTISSCSRSG